MKITWPKMRRAGGVILTCLIIIGSLMSGLPFGAPIALAQSGAQAASKMVVVGGDGATLYTAPQGEEISDLPLGSVLTATQRTADVQWIAVRTDEGVSGWVRVADVVAFGLDKLPVEGTGADTAATAAPTPAATKPAATKVPTATPTRQPSPTPQPTETPEPTATPLPTATPEPPTPAATDAPATGATATGAATAAAGNQGVVASSARSLVAVVAGAGAGLYDMPDGDKVQDLPMATTVTAALRNAAGDWVFVSTGEGDSGWTPVQGLVAFGLERLPVLDVTSAGDEAAATEPPAAAEDIAAEDAAASAQGADTDEESTDAADTDAADTDAADTDTADTDTADSSTATTVEAPPAVGEAAGVAATVTITEQRLNIRSGPGSAYRVIEKAQPGEVLTATARTPDSIWVQVTRDDLENGAGWVSAEFLAVEDLAALPVDDSFAADEESTPTAEAATPTAAAPATTTDTDAGDTDALPTTTPAPAESTPVSVSATSIVAEPAGLSGTLVFQDGRNNIYAYDLAGGGVRWLTNGYDPDITRDGSRVTFVRGGGAGNGVWTINIDGSNERHIHGGGEMMRGPKWSPDAQWIVFSRNNTNWKCFDTEFFGCVSLFELKTKFPGIPEQIRSDVLYALFLRDTARLEFPNWIITRINPDGGDFRDINALDSAVSPDWNEAGIVYQGKPGLEITQDTPDGRTQALIQEGWDWDPDWEPNGGRIVYQSKEGSHWEIFSINPDGGGVFALTRPETTLVDQLPSNTAPAFSPDGQHIVYISNRDENEEAGLWRLWVMDNGGGNKRPLPIDITIDYGFSSDQVASWGQ